MITDTELSLMRTTLTDSYPDTGTIYAWSWVNDGEGGGTVAFSVSGTVACRVAPAGISGAEDLIAMRQSNVQFYRISLPHTTSITARDQVRSLGNTYEIVAPITSRSRKMAVRLYAVKVD